MLAALVLLALVATILVGAKVIHAFTVKLIRRFADGRDNVEDQEADSE